MPLNNNDIKLNLPKNSTEYFIKYSQKITDFVNMDITYKTITEPYGFFSESFDNMMVSLTETKKTYLGQDTDTLHKVWIKIILGEYNEKKKKLLGDSVKILNNHNSSIITLRLLFYLYFITTIYKLVSQLQQDSFFNTHNLTHCCGRCILILLANYQYDNPPRNELGNKNSKTNQAANKPIKSLFQTIFHNFLNLFYYLHIAPNDLQLFIQNTLQNTPAIDQEFMSPAVCNLLNIRGNNTVKQYSDLYKKLIRVKKSLEFTLQPVDNINNSSLDAYDNNLYQSFNNSRES